MLEVGPGLGSLTLALLDRGARVTAVEIDPLLTRQLPKTIAEHSHSEINRLTVLNRDILTLQRAELTDEPTALVAEVAERLAAEPGGKDYGVPSVKVRFFGNVRRYGMVSPTVFWPIPRVYSGLVRIDRHEASPWPTDPDFRAQVFELIDIAFAQRRKTSRNAFAEWAGSGNESARRLLAASIDPSRRGETLSVADFIRLLQRSGDQEPKDEAQAQPQTQEHQARVV